MDSRKRKASRLLNTGKAIVLPVAVFLIFLLLTDGKFANEKLLITVARQTVLPMLIAMAMSSLMIMGMWDFSAGSVVFAAAIFGAKISQATDTGIPGIVVGAILVSLVLMSISGILYNLMKVPSLVLSMGLVMVYEVLPRLCFEAGTAEIPMSQNTLSLSPWSFIIFAVMFVIFYVVLNHTTFGYNVHAIGANQIMAYNAGVNISSVKFKAYMLSGLFLGVAGALFMFQGIRVSAASMMASVGIIFDSMMGVFLAMVLRKYCGFPFGLLIGTFTMRMLGTGLISLGFSSTVRAVFTGLFLLVILVYAANQGRFSAWRMRKKLGDEADKLYASGNK